MVKWLESEVSKIEKTGQTATRFSLLNWAATIYASVPKEGQLEDPQFLSLLTSFSTLLYLLLDPSAKIKTSLRNSAVVITRRAIRSVSHPTLTEYPPWRVLTLAMYISSVMLRSLGSSQLSHLRKPNLRSAMLPSSALRSTLQLI
jgi:hypothetical protein